MQMAITMIVLNEEDFIERQLKFWLSKKFVSQFIIVEGAVENYPRWRVSPRGVSIDKTCDVICSYAVRDDRVVHIRGEWKDKLHMRNAMVDKIKAPLMLQVDADEFYTDKDAERISSLPEQYPNKDSFIFKQWHIWWPASMQKANRPVFTYRIEGGYFDVVHVRCHRWKAGNKYIRHDKPAYADGKAMVDVVSKVVNIRPDTIKCIHMGFANNDILGYGGDVVFYKKRGEDQSRPVTTLCRSAWLTWREGETLPDISKIKQLGRTFYSLKLCNLPKTFVPPSAIKDYTSRRN